MVNYFEMFGLDVHYNIDESALTVNYLKKQMSSHPDIDGSEVASSCLNVAYSVLKDPLSRAEYILALQGKDTNKMPNRLALKMFELREQFDKINSAEDKNVFIDKQRHHVDNLLKTLSKYSIDSDGFITTFCEAKFIHSFLEKAVTNACNWN